MISFDKPALDQKAVYRAITDDATCATVLHIIALSQYGEDIYTIDILELLARLEEDFGGRVTEDNESKLNAIILAVSTDMFYQDTEAFRAICNTMLSGDPGLGEFDELTLPEILWGIWEVGVNREPGDFSPAIKKIIDHASSTEYASPEDTTLPDDPDAGYGYAQNIMDTQKTHLEHQLFQIGVDPQDLPPMASLSVEEAPGAIETQVALE